MAPTAETVAQGATDRRVSGVITALDGTSMTLAPICAKAPVTGKIDARTRIVVADHNASRPGRVQDLQVTSTVKAELDLDDVWSTVTIATR